MNRLVSVFLFLLLLPALSGPEIYAQNLIGLEEDQYAEFYYRVKQFNEFADRFNFEKDYIGKEIGAEEAADLKREVLLLTLFDREDPRLNPESKEFSREYLDLITDFINSVCENDLFLDRNSENIYARAICSGLYHGKRKEFSIILQQEHVGRDALKWVMKDIEADFLEFLEEDSIMLRFLPPTSDELDFMELRRALSDSTHLDGYADRNFEYSPLSVFFFLRYSGVLHVETVLEVEYIIRDIPGYEFTLHDFNRSSKNSGWLIRELNLHHH